MCNPEYWSFVKELREEESIGFISQKKITDSDHYSFMVQNHTNYRICLIDDKPVGFVGVVGEDVRVAVHKDHKKQGIGKFMINEMYKYYKFSAKVKIDNEASLALFKSCGFVEKYITLEKK